LKRLTNSFSVCILFIAYFFTKQTSAQTNYTTYYGNLHAHSAYSDGNKENPNATPTDNYAFANTALCLDFLGISEHNHFSSTNNPGMLLPLYALGIQQAQAYTNAHPGFVALFGMEWGVISNGGHVVLYGIDSLIGWETLSTGNNYDIFVAKSDYQGPNGLFQQIVNRKSANAFATLAHPNSSDYNNLFYGAYNPIADSAVVGVSVESGPAFSTDTTYTDTPSDMSFLSYYMQALAKGYHVGPTIDHDNHYMTFGKTNTSRLAILAQQLTKNTLLEAMRKRRFFATQDCDTKLMLSINQQDMGSITNGSLVPTITVTASDPTSPNAIPAIKIMKGVPGSGTIASSLVMSNGVSLNFSDLNLQIGDEAYYYADVTINGKRSISAPIWYRRLPGTSAIASSQNIDWDVACVNPIVGDALQLQWSLAYPSNFTLQVFNTIGQCLYQLPVSINASSNTSNLPLTLDAGMYMLRISNEKGEKILRVLKP
jgi:hypothetical protein